eukprot:843905-Prorocentrum_minimum.AAC.1
MLAVQRHLSSVAAETQLGHNTHTHLLQFLLRSRLPLWPLGCRLGAVLWDLVHQHVLRFLGGISLIGPRAPPREWRGSLVRRNFRLLHIPCMRSTQFSEALHPSPAVPSQVEKRSVKEWWRWSNGKRFGLGVTLDKQTLSLQEDQSEITLRVALLSANHSEIGLRAALPCADQWEISLRVALPSAWVGESSKSKDDSCNTPHNRTLRDITREASLWGIKCMHKRTWPAELGQRAYRSFCGVFRGVLIGLEEAFLRRGLICEHAVAVGLLKVMLTKK